MEYPEQVHRKLRQLPDSPGVYQMKDARGKILYIGKALVLRNRVSSYFTAAAESDPRIAQLVTEIRDLDWIVVPTEIDALMLESSLIRTFKPRYNTMLKDDKSYPYVKISMNEKFPRVMLTRQYLDDGARYWGPMTSVGQVRSAMKFIAGMFQLRTCKLEIDDEHKYLKPCLDFHLKLCSAPCVGYIDEKKYGALVQYAVDFFNGNYGTVIDEMKKRMWEAAENRDYESAARYRDLIEAAEKSFQRTRMIGRPGENYDVLGLARSRDRACVLVMPVRDGRLIGDRKFVLDHRLEDSADNDVLAGFLKLHYANPQNVPPELVLPHQPQDGEVIRQWLGRLRFQALEHRGEAEEVALLAGSFAENGEAGVVPELGNADGTGIEITDSAGMPIRRVLLTTPKRGKKLELLGIANRNAQERLHTVLLGGGGDYVVTPGQKALKEHLSLADYPRRIEGYDIANLQGQQATGAMVVFTGGRKDAPEYRLFNIRLKQTPDDYAMLMETLHRRLKRLLTDPKWKRQVDLVMIDGGKGQLNSVRRVFDQMMDDPDLSTEQREVLEGIKLCSLAKQEELVYHYNDIDQLEEIRLPHTDPGLRLLVELRNEAHRFGNTQHSKMKEKAMRISVLDTVPGLGETRKRELLRHFGSVKRLREATVDELLEVKGIGRAFAEHIRKYLERDNELEGAKVEKKREMRIRRIRREGDPDRPG
ncbi:excinuclease ABC subunit C [bacterium]|nr:excinuclease ABC subunit C [bacterium]